MATLPAFLPTSIGSIVSIVIQILYSTITIWLSAQIVTKRASIQNALIFSVVSYFALIFVRFLPIPSIPFINAITLAEIAIKSLLAMKFFDASFNDGLSMAGVQMILGLVLLFPF